MKIMIEVSGGSVTGITATDDCEIYLVDHDDIENRNFHPVDNAVEVMHPDCITGEIDLTRCLYCKKVPRSKLVKESFKIYFPYCSYHCQETHNMKQNLAALPKRRIL